MTLIPGESGSSLRGLDSLYCTMGARRDGLVCKQPGANSQLVLSSLFLIMNYFTAQIMYLLNAAACPFPLGWYGDEKTCFLIF